MAMDTISRSYDSGTLDLQHLRVFDVLIRENSLTRAARVLGVSRSTLQRKLELLNVR